jgi:hypothetical protein
MKKVYLITSLIVLVSPLLAADFKLGRYASPNGPIDSLPTYPGIVFTNYFEFRDDGVMLAFATAMGHTIIGAAMYKIEASTIIATDSEDKIIVFDIQKDGSLICRTTPWEGIVLVKVEIQE